MKRFTPRNIDSLRAILEKNKQFFKTISTYIVSGIFGPGSVLLALFVLNKFFGSSDLILHEKVLYKSNLLISIFSLNLASSVHRFRADSLTNELYKSLPKASLLLFALLLFSYFCIEQFFLELDFLENIVVYLYAVSLYSFRLSQIEFVAKNETNKYAVLSFTQAFARIFFLIIAYILLRSNFQNSILVKFALESFIFLAIASIVLPKLNRDNFLVLIPALKFSITLLFQVVAFAFAPYILSVCIDALPFMEREGYYIYMRIFTIPIILANMMLNYFSTDYYSTKSENLWEIIVAYTAIFFMNMVLLCYVYWREDVTAVFFFTLYLSVYSLLYFGYLIHTRYMVLNGSIWMVGLPLLMLTTVLYFIAKITSLHPNIVLMTINVGLGFLIGVVKLKQVYVKG